MSKRNWDVLKKQKPQDSVKYRDVYEDQQLERSQIEAKQTPTSRIILASVLAVIIFIASYILACMFEFGSDITKQYMGSEESIDSSLSDTSTTTDVSTETVYADFETCRNSDIDVSGITVSQSDVDVYANQNGFQRIDDENYFDLHEQIPCDEMATIYARYLVLTKTIVINDGSSDTEVVNDETGESSEDSSDGSEEYVSDLTYMQAGLMRYFKPTVGKIGFAFVVAAIFWGVFYQILMRNLDAQNLMSDTTDINQYPNDQHIALPEELQQKFDWFPDVGAHSNVQVSSMISHVALMNKGLKKVQIAKRAKKDIIVDGEVEYYKGEILLDDDENPIMETVPMIDEAFMDDLFTASGSPEDKEYRRRYDATAIPYNPGGKDRTKQGGKYDTVAEMINHDWVLPEYEPQRPGGAYLVDTEPVNTIKNCGM